MPSLENKSINALHNIAARTIWEHCSQARAYKRVKKKERKQHR
jgi:hypothetical protein